MDVRRRHLPHWDVPGATYFVTACLAGSIPSRGLAEIERYRAVLASRPRPAKVTPPAWKATCWKLVFARRDEWLDCRPAVRHFDEPMLAKIVADTIYHFVGERYDLLAYCVMPSHFHWVFQPLVGQVSQPVLDRLPRAEERTGWETCPAKRERSELERFMHSLKLHTARECNRALRRHGQFWQDESYDHCIRDEEELERVIQYVEQNPVKAGLAKTAEEWPFSSAHDRAKQGLPFGAALVKERR